MEKQLSIAKKRYSFKNAYEMVPLGQINSLKQELHSVLGIRNRTSWSNKLKGIVSPSIDIVEGVEAIFNRYGIVGCWTITEIEQ